MRIRADDNHEKIIVNGERQTNDNKIFHFEQSFIVPQTCNIEDTSGILEGDIFYVTFPKRQSLQKQEIPRVPGFTSLVEKNETRNKEDDEKEKEGGGGCTDESSKNGLLDNISKNLKKTRYFILTTLLAFSLGVGVSHYHHSSKQRSKDPNKG